jgi:hypothetical protein
MVSPEHVVALREAGHSWSKIARRMRVGSGTARRAYRSATTAAATCQKPEKGPPVSEEEPADGEAS